jgi:hypothetical protein
MTYGEIIEEHAPGVNLSSMAPRGSDDPARPVSRLPFGLELRLGRDADEMMSESSMGHQDLALGHVTIDAATLRLHGARTLPAWLGFHIETLGKSSAVIVSEPSRSKIPAAAWSRCWR